MTAVKPKRIADFFFRITSQIAQVCEVCGSAIPAGTTIAAKNGHFFHEHCAVPVRATVPEAAPRPRPVRRSADGPTYALDAEALCRATKDPISAIETLADATARPGWDRDAVCERCENWSAKQGLTKQPVRPGAKDCTTACDGCLFSHLDEQSRPRHQGFGRRLLLTLGVDSEETNLARLSADHFNAESLYDANMRFRSMRQHKREEQMRGTREGHN